MSSFSSWWDALALIEKIYWCLALPFSVLLVFQLIATFAGADADVDSDGHHHDGDLGGDFQLFTVKNFIVFFTIFGWTGLGCVQSGISNMLSIVIAAIAGFVSMLIMASIFYFMSRMVASGTLKMKNAVGKTGEAYLRIPAARTGTGKVNINIQGSNRELDAMTMDILEIPSGAIVKVVDIINENTLLVTKE